MNNKKAFFTEYLGKFIAISGVVILVLAIFLFLWQDYSISFDQEIKSEKVGQFGDFVGGLIGSIWAFSGVVLFYVALKEQRKDFTTNKEVLNAQTEALQLQVKEFELQRKELVETREIFETQKFETTFFNLLKFHKEITNSLFIKINKKINDHIVESNDYKGERFFGKGKQLIEGNLFKLQYQEILVGEKKKDMALKFIKNQKYLTDEIVERIVRIINGPIGPLNEQKIAYLMFYSNHQMYLSKYMNQLLSIIRFLDKSKESIESLSIDLYIDLLKSQLIDLEIKFLWIHCHSFDREEINLLKKYQIIKNSISLFRPIENN